MKHSPVGLISPLLIVSDLQRSIAFYTGTLGFTCLGTWGEPPVFSILRRDRAELMLSTGDADAEPRPNGGQQIWDLYVNVEDAAAEAEAIRAAGGTIARGPCEMEYGMLEIDVRDPDGALICFGSALPGGAAGPDAPA
jgi:predicted enzyme related to lactoylglutathione lyase